DRIPRNNEVRSGSSPREGQTQVKSTQKSILPGDSNVNCFTQAFSGQGRNGSGKIRYAECKRF
ncbi:MAG TPA: hypothetical protein VNO32_19745, partial [Candidatus Acidoferrum sp.]|nr:hypothetical protein [Candidatus Acidoferrum sp.]